MAEGDTYATGKARGGGGGNVEMIGAKSQYSAGGAAHLICMHNHVPQLPSVSSHASYNHFPLPTAADRQSCYVTTLTGGGSSNSIYVEKFHIYISSSCNPNGSTTQRNTRHGFRPANSDHGNLSTTVASLPSLVSHIDHIVTTNASAVSQQRRTLIYLPHHDQGGTQSHVIDPAEAAAGGHGREVHVTTEMVGSNINRVDNQEDKQWPFLARFPISCFSICLGLASQTVLWKTLAEASSMRFLRVPHAINFVLWCAALLLLLVVSATYALKCIFYGRAVKREFAHPVRVNMFFAPWIAAMSLTLGVPPAISTSLNPWLWALWMAPVFALELKIYGQWVCGGQKRLLSRVANPVTQLSLMGNFVGSLLASACGLREPSIFFWAVGITHYLVLLVTLYQRLPSTTSLSKELHPAFFLFIAVPSSASMAWTRIVGDFDLVARIAYFLAMFLYACLVVRIKFFCGYRFSVAWWAYTSPMTTSAIATLHYSLKIRHPFTQGMALVLSLVSSVTVLSLFVVTILHAFFWRTLFPNDVVVGATAIGDDITNNYRAKRKAKSRPIGRSGSLF